MNAFAAAPRPSRLPALAAAAVLHAILLALLIMTPRPRLPPIGSSVPVNIVSEAPFTDSRPAVQAPRTETAAAPLPKPEAPPAPPAEVEGPPAPAPAPRPRPEIRPPTSQATAAPSRTPQRPVPASPAALRPSPQAPAAARPFDFSRMQQIINAARRSTGSPVSSARPGPARAETAPQARPNAGQGVSQSDLAGLEQLLERLWNPNCDVAGGSSVHMQVRFLVGLTGHVVGNPEVVSAGGAEPAVVEAAVLRAKDAIRAVAPYAEPYYGQTITTNFDAKKGCEKK